MVACNYNNTIYYYGYSSATDHFFISQSKDLGLKALSVNKTSTEWILWETKNLQPALTAGAGITINSNNVISATPDVFWATKGTTTAAEVETALNEGKVVMCENGGVYYTMVYATSNNYYFAAATATNLRQTMLDRNTNVWSGVTNSLVQAKLTAGAGIAITNNEISSSTITTTYENQTLTLGDSGTGLISIPGVLSTDTVIVSPTPASMSA